MLKKNINFASLQASSEKANRIHNTDRKLRSRSDYQRDRDRILYSLAFRRLIGKTQIFNVGIGEHYRNRLTHTLAVMQIATSISKRLGLNTELTEAIAMGHDIGHTPFGHVGERTLNHIMNNCDVVDKFGICIDEKQRGFKHNLQGLRRLSCIEKRSKEFSGLNLTTDTLWGIVNHTTVQWDKCTKFEKSKKYCLMRMSRKEYLCPNYDQKNTHGVPKVDFYDECLSKLPEMAWTFEAFVVKYADEIAQMHHDVEDGILAGIFKAKEFTDMFRKHFEKTPCFTSNVAKDLEEIEKEITSKTKYVLPLLSKFIIWFYIGNYSLSVAKVLQKEIIRKFEIKDNNEFHKKKKTIWETPHIIKKENKRVSLVGLDKIDYIMNFNEDFIEPNRKLKELLKTTIISSRKAQLMDGKGTFIIRKLFEAYLNTPNQLPDRVVLKLFVDYGLNPEDSNYDLGLCRQELGNHKSLQGDDIRILLCRNICDYISSMTDSYALRQYEKLYGSKVLQ